MSEQKGSSIKELGYCLVGFILGGSYFYFTEPTRFNFFSLGPTLKCFFLFGSFFLLVIMVKLLHLAVLENKKRNGWLSQLLGLNKEAFP